MKVSFWWNSEDNRDFWTSKCSRPNDDSDLEDLSESNDVGTQWFNDEICELL